MIFQKHYMYWQHCGNKRANTHGRREDAPASARGVGRDSTMKPPSGGHGCVTTRECGWWLKTIFYRPSRVKKQITHTMQTVKTLVHQRLVRTER